MNTLPHGAGTAVFAGGGAWLPPRQRGGTHTGDEAVILSGPSRILVAERLEEISGLLSEIEAEQAQGRYVAGYLAYEAGAAFGFEVRTPAPDALPLAWMAVYPQEAAAVLPAEEWRSLLDATDVAAVRQSLEGVTPRLSVDSGRIRPGHRPGA